MTQIQLLSSIEQIQKELPLFKFKEIKNLCELLKGYFQYSYLFSYCLTFNEIIFLDNIKRTVPKTWLEIPYYI